MPNDPARPIIRDGQALTARRLDGLRQDLAQTQRDYADNFRPPAPRHKPPFTEYFLGVVRSSPPAGVSGSDYTDARYYVDRAIPSNTMDKGDELVADVEQAPNLSGTVTATNIAELPAQASSPTNSNGTGSHSLAEGTIVHIFGFRTRDTIDGDGTVTAGVSAYVFTWGGLPAATSPRQVITADDNLNWVADLVQTP